MKPNRAVETPSTAAMPTTQNYYEGGKFVFRSGIVPTVEECIILHVNKVTGEHRLPQSPCEWLTKPRAASDSVPVLESFEATAERIMDTQLNYKGKLYGHHPSESAQPYTMKSGVRPKMKAPFLLQTETTPDGTFAVTAWFQVYFDSDDHVIQGIPVFALGKDWSVQAFRTQPVLKDLSAGDLEAYERAIDARGLYSDDEDDEDSD